LTGHEISAAPFGSMLSHLSTRQIQVTAAALVASVVTAALHFADVDHTLTFIVGGVALVFLATIVSIASEALSESLSPAATGIVQSALGNLPELFVAIFALRAGLIEVVQAAIVGSILGNGLLVLGFAFFLGGLKNGRQWFPAEGPRMNAILLLLAIFALIIPTISYEWNTPAKTHSEPFSVACAIVLLLVFVMSMIYSLVGVQTHEAAGETHEGVGVLNWPPVLTAGMLGLGGLGAAFVSDWFVAALEPATKSLGLSQAFTGLVIVAIAGNGVEHVVGVQFAIKNKADYAVNIITQSSLQVALALAPLLVLLSYVVGAPIHLTLVLPPMLVAVLFLSAIISAIIVYDGESTWLEGAILIGLYGIVAAAFWWG
jgi:Ca2+:H+ antiporter